MCAEEAAFGEILRETRDLVVGSEPSLWSNVAPAENVWPVHANGSDSGVGHGEWLGNEYILLSSRFDTAVQSLLRSRRWPN